MPSETDVSPKAISSTPFPVFPKGKSPFIVGRMDGWIGMGFKISGLLPSTLPWSLSEYKADRNAAKRHGKGHWQKWLICERNTSPKCPIWLTKPLRE